MLDSVRTGPCVPGYLKVVPNRRGYHATKRYLACHLRFDGRYLGLTRLSLTGTDALPGVASTDASAGERGPGKIRQLEVDVGPGGHYDPKHEFLVRSMQTLPSLEHVPTAPPSDVGNVVKP